MSDGFDLSGPITATCDILGVPHDDRDGDSVASDFERETRDWCDRQVAVTERERRAIKKIETLLHVTTDLRRQLQEAKS